MGTLAALSLAVSMLFLAAQVSAFASRTIRVRWTSLERGEHAVDRHRGEQREQVQDRIQVQAARRLGRRTPPEPARLANENDKQQSRCPAVAHSHHADR